MATLTARVRRRLAVAVYLGGWRVVRLLPERLAYALFALVADVAWWRRGVGVRRLEANLARALGTTEEGRLRAASRAGMRSYLRYWCDAFRLPAWSRERIEATCRIEGDAPVRAHLAAGRGVVLALSHTGNWDHAGAWSNLRLAPVTTVAERLEPAEVSQAFLDFRRRLGMEILNLGDPDVFGTLVRRLRDGGFVPLLSDRDLTSRGVEVTLLGEPARMAAGPATLADLTGAALFAVTITYERLDPASARAAGTRWGIVVRISPEVPPSTAATRPERVAEMVQACADHLSEGIRAAPQDWHMLQPVFTADLDPARRARPGAVPPAPRADAGPGRTA
ncbi:phosphatidylinositol mannoside acyltransferase [Thalassiella azotivora]